MAWARRTLAFAVCSAAYASLLACGGAEFSSSNAGGDSGSGGAGGKLAASGGKDTSPSGADSGGRGGASGGTAGATGGGGDPGAGSGGVNPGGAGAGGQPPVGPMIPKQGLLYWFAGDVGFMQEQGMAKWADQSENGNHAFQLLPELQPKLSEPGLRPLPVLDFDGQDDYLELPEVSVAWSEGLSLFLVAGATSHDGCVGYIELSNGPEIDDLHLGVHSAMLQYEIQAEILTAPPDALPLGELLLAEIHHGGAQNEAPAELRINGVQAGASVLPLPVDVLRVSNFIGRTLYAGCVPFSGSLAELIFYSRRVSAEERAAIEMYLMNKWECCN